MDICFLDPIGYPDMDYAKLGLSPAPTSPAQPDPLKSLGWRPQLASQLTDDERQTLRPARVMAVHRSTLNLATAEGPLRLPPMPHNHADMPVAVGDWVLIDAPGTRIDRRLDRLSVLQRRAAGPEGGTQLIAANVDTLFIVTSCNADFNVARLERYLALAYDGGATPVIVLTKPDLAQDPADWVRRARSIDRSVLVEVLDARDPAAARRLAPWCGPGQTVALVGSSGVGKTTLTNALTGGNDATAGIREDDAKGRHTTTARALKPLAGGGLLLDTPGMRELGLSDAAEGIATVFRDIEDLAASCRFRDCAHDGEPGCAVVAAVDAGQIDRDRLERWRKLRDEDTHNTRSTAERRRLEKSFGKIVKAESRKKGRERGD
jgi:ribosome biogenesis GTPase / thiamine phosphate phosphatase